MGNETGNTASSNVVKAEAAVERLRGIDFENAQKRYRNDVAFHTLVDSLQHVINETGLTIDDVKIAAQFLGDFNRLRALTNNPRFGVVR